VSWLRGALRLGSTPADVVHAENKWRLLRYRPLPGVAQRRTPVLMVPSLINRHYVLDLLPERSFARWLLGQGHPLHVIDWGTPGDEDRLLGFDDYCDGYLGRALRKVAWAAPDRRAHLLGYCLGGTLAAIHAAARPEHVASLALFAAPISFAQGGLLGEWTRSPTFDVRALVDGFGNVPWPLMQLTFHALKPTLGASKLVGLFSRLGSKEAWRTFLALEAWGNDNVSFPGGCYAEYVERLYQEDAFVRGEMRLSGVRAAPASIRCPLFVVSFAHDHIVPPASAEAIEGITGSRDVRALRLRGGHVGAVVSGRAARDLWEPLSRWWVERDAPLPRRAVVTRRSVLRTSASASRGA
jgi:polyhydroxyalkanoate synthase subunit PhaC